MPLFERELNAVANWLKRRDLTIWLHTAAPTDASPTNGRTTVGGGAYETGIALAASDISDAVNGDISNNVALAFGMADEDVGMVTHWSGVRGNDAVVHGTLPSRAIGHNDTYTINAGQLQLNGSTT